MTPTPFISPNVFYPDCVGWVPPPDPVMSHFQPLLDMGFQFVLAIATDAAHRTYVLSRSFFDAPSQKSFQRFTELTVQLTPPKLVWSRRHPSPALCERCGDTPSITNEVTDQDVVAVCAHCLTPGASTALVEWGWSDSPGVSGQPGNPQP